jgi:hypothetical protein
MFDKVRSFLKGSGWLVAFGLVIVLMFFPSMCQHLDLPAPLGFLGDVIAEFFGSPGISGHFSNPDTVYVKPPISPEDPTHHWYSPVVQYVVHTDTVTVVQYEQAPPTVHFVGATIPTNGMVRVEIMVNDSQSVILEGELAPYGDTHVVVNPDSTVKFVGNRFGFEPILTAGVDNGGPLVEIETFYINHFLGIDALHLPNLAVDYTAFASEEEPEFRPGLGISADISARHSPIHIGGGAMYSIKAGEVQPFFSVTTILWNP